MKNKLKIRFINHASLLIQQGETSLLSDPWYQGDIFHKGWNLIHNFTDNEIYDLLKDVTHIWISHEHPDHFSISFFKKFEHILKKNNIQVLFQKTLDNRVKSFLLSCGLNTKILNHNSWFKLSEDLKILCFKDGFYDSGLVIDTGEKKILNLNDCEINDKKKCKEILKLTGECDVLASQFSYAAWKGGKRNIAWRKAAAKEKINSLKLQVSFFKPKILIPFASFIYFSNQENYYLNDSVNKPSDVVKAFENSSTFVKVMKPFEKLDNFDETNNEDSILFWDKAFKGLAEHKLNLFESVSLIDLNSSFRAYTERVFKNNSRNLIYLIRIFSPISSFKPVFIKLNDLNKVIKFDLFSKTLDLSNKNPDISMSSESLNFILNNTFGFDTLTVNGCFEEESRLGFSKATRTLAIENLNNLGISFNISLIFNIKIIVLFLSRLLRVSKKLSLEVTN